MSKEFPRCDEYRCFGYRDGKCTILEAVCDRKPCPFFQTRSEVKENRERSILRLIRKDDQTALKFYLRLRDEEIESYAEKLIKD